MQVKDIITIMERLAPLNYQESYDNCGLQVGDAATTLTGVLLTLDVTEAVVDEAARCGCNMIVAHHPLIFGGLKRLTGRNYVERTVLKAIKNDIAIYAAHTNLDNMRHGVNARIAQKLGLVNTRILSPMSNTLSKLYTYAPVNIADKVRDAMFDAGAGAVGGYAECSFNTAGKGTFRPGEATKPAIGKAGGEREWVEEIKIEVLVEKHTERAVLDAMRRAHIYEEVAYELVPLANANQQIGAGMVGDLPQPMEAADFMAHLKMAMKTGCIRHTALLKGDVKKIALCGGAGSFLLKDAIGAGADFFVTGDFKYHQFFDAEGRIVIADIGHYESEQFTTELFAETLAAQLPGARILMAETQTNPVFYY